MTAYTYQYDPSAAWPNKAIEWLSRQPITILPAYDIHQAAFVPTVNAPNMLGIQATIEEMLLLVNLRKPLDTEINVQQGDDMIQLAAKVLAAGGISTNRIDENTRRWVEQCVETALHATVHLKRYFNIARPCQIDARVRPPFDPGHPSFPSGHATVAFAAAAAFSMIAPNDIPAVISSMYSEARSIAHNREVAGVHTAADTIAGFTVAERVVLDLAQVAHLNLPTLRAAVARFFL